MKVVIVGGVAGGATAAARIRRLDESAEITIFEKSNYISYANCGLPYYIGGEITDREELTLQTPESFYSRFRINVFVRHEVLSIDTAAKTVKVKNRDSGEVFSCNYDKLVLSPGARPIKPPFLGSDDERIFTLRNVEDTFRIKDYLTAKAPKRAVVVGGGFIGIEVAENLVRLGIDVTLVEAAPQLMAPFDEDMAAFIHSEVRRNGVKLRLGAAVESFSSVKGGLCVRINGGEDIVADIAVLAIGVAPDTSLAKEAGLELGIKGSIVVNDRMETSAPDVYAVGDAAEIKNFVTGKPALISLAGPANKEGRIAADNICGKDSRYGGGQGSSVIKVFRLTAAATGVNERTAKLEGIDADKVILSPMSHAGYYPGGKIMTMKVLFERGTYRLLGAQIVGYEGVDKRIDVLATAIRAGMKATELVELDLAYAPPYSSAKDPVNMAGFMIENIRDGLVGQWYYDEVPSLKRDGSVTLLDVRTEEECAASGMIDGFVNIPVDELRDRIGEIPEGKPVYVICQSGLRSYVAARILAGRGYEVYNFAGGYRFYDVVVNDRLCAESSTACGKDSD